MRALPSIYTKIYLIFFLALHAEFRVRVLRNVDFNLAKVIQDFFPSFEIHWYYSETLEGRLNPALCVLQTYFRNLFKIDIW